jgi:D-sedoheptulose 7-phosphate isomerase
MYPGINSYLLDVQNSISQVNVVHIDEMVNALFHAFVHGRTVFTMGNGASAALAAHIACDLGKGTASDIGQGVERPAGPRLRILSLTDNVALMTAYGNDVHYHDVFLEQLKGLLRPGDVVLGISGSGGSPNVLRALEYARMMGSQTLGMTGHQQSAHLMCTLCDICLQAPSTMMEQIEDLHVMFSHAITIALRQKIADHVINSVGLHESTAPLKGVATAGNANGRANGQVPTQAFHNQDGTGELEHQSPSL